MSQTEMKESEQLLKAYAEHRDEEAFRDLVDRYSRLVYSTALRQVGDAHAAEDITQLVFVHLARQAHALPAKTVIGGWLYRDAVFTSSKYRRSLARRRIREDEAVRMTEQNNDNADARWASVAPLIEEAITRLGIRDRDAIVLRCFEGQPLRSVGAALGITEDAARMRVERALEKLRRFFVRRGVKISITGLASMLASDALGNVPPETMTIAAHALAQANVEALPVSSWLSSQVLKFGLASILVVGLVSAFIWNSPSRPSRSARAALQADETRSLQIKGGIRRTTSNPTAMSFHTFIARTVRSGEQFTITNSRSNYRLVASATASGGGFQIESSLFENASSTAPIRFPTVTATNGQMSIVSNGIYSFEFTATLTSTNP